MPLHRPIQRSQRYQSYQSYQRYIRRGCRPPVFVIAILIAAVMASVPIATTLTAATVPVEPADAQERIACDGATLVRHLALVDEGHTDHATLDEAIAEAEAIWATAGVRLLWVSGHGSGPRPDAFVVLRAGRRPNAMRTAAMMTSGNLHQLGWVRYSPDGARAKLMEVSLSAVKATLMNAWYIDKRLAYHPIAVQVQILGRALGRIIAHEFGHWLVGLGHENEGLMKAILRPRDLMHGESPSLPSSWTGAGDSRMAALRARCE